MKRFCIQRILRKMGVQLCLENVFDTKCEKNCLIKYIQDPFFSLKGSRYHQSHEQVMVMARIFYELGYNVDVINYNDLKVNLHKEYDVVLDICVQTPNIYDTNLALDAKRIVYFTGSESLFANNAELERVDKLEERKGKRLTPRRQAPLIDPIVEKYDGAIFVGYDECIGTYSQWSLKKKFSVPNTGYDFGDRISYQNRNINSFLYFGSSGCVHKGLDILLDVFSEKDFPCKLYVCGPYEQEEDFYELYKDIISNSPNIIPMGFVDIWSEQFKNICDECTFTIIPSCSEGVSGTAITGMSAGLIPICSKICGLNNDEAILLEDCSIDSVRKCILDASKMDEFIIKRLRERSLNLAKTKFNIRSYEDSLRKALTDILC